MTSGLGSETIGIRLARIARRLPDKIAIVEKDSAITFGQLDADATTIARQIMAASQGGSGVVWLFFDSKLAAIRATFGVCRTGHGIRSGLVGGDTKAATSEAWTKPAICISASARAAGSRFAAIRST